MRVLIFESNLMWSSRMVQSAKRLGHEPFLRSEIPTSSEGAEAAIVNLGDPSLDPKALVAALKGLGVPVIAHAGHKEKQLIELGREAEVEILATNGQITFKLEELLEKARKVARRSEP